MKNPAGSLPAWGEWIEIRVTTPRSGYAPSLPAWGEWIEISLQAGSA